MHFLSVSLFCVVVVHPYLPTTWEEMDVFPSSGDHPCDPPKVLGLGQDSEPLNVLSRVEQCCLF